MESPGPGLGISGLPGLSMDLDLPDVDTLSAINDNFLGEYLSQLEQRYDGSSLQLPPSSHDLGDQDLLLFEAEPPGPTRFDNAVDLSTVPGLDSPVNSDPKDSAGSMQGHHSSKGSAGSSQGHSHDGESAGGTVKVKAEGDSAAVQRSAGTKKVTPQRKQNNRRAQQRYREKRRQQAAELEATVAALTSQLEAMQSVQLQAAQLSGENEALRKRADVQQQTIVQLQKQLKAQMLQSHQIPLAAELQVASADSDDMDALHMPPPVGSEAACKQLNAVVQQIQDLLRTANLPLDAVSPEAALYAPVMDRITQLARQGCNLCVRVTLEAPVCPIEKADTKTSSVGVKATTCALFKGKFTPILDCCRMTDAQIEKSLAARSQLLTVLKDVYQERSRLNMLAMSIMLPRPHPNRQFEGPEGKIRCIERYDSSCALQHGNELDEVLDSLKLNLRAEQKLLLKLTQTFLLEVLTPVQVAVMLVQASPYHLDALGLTNLIAYRSGLVECTEESKPAAF